MLLLGAGGEDVKLEDELALGVRIARRGVVAAGLLMVAHRNDKHREEQDGLKITPSMGGNKQRRTL